MIDKDLLLKMFNLGIEEVKPKNLISKHIKIIESKVIHIGDKKFDKFKSIIPICIGKASVEMAICFNEVLKKNSSKFYFKVKKGFLVVNKENFKTVENFHCFFAGHPIPDEKGLEASSFLVNYLKSFDEKDLIVLMLSGGGSAMLPNPPNSISLEDKICVNQMLLSSGANIKEINTVRKHLSSLKGGNFLKHSYPATTTSLIISDVVGDDLSSISSGLTVPDSTTFGNAISISKKYNIWKTFPKNIKHYLSVGLKSPDLETPKKNNKIFGNCFNSIIASNSISLDCIKRYLNSLNSNIECKFWKKNIEGDVKEVAFEFVKYVSTYKNKNPLILLSGGETTVKIVGNGKGGRNQEFALYVCLFMKKLMPKKKYFFLSGGTDGRDGPTDSAGGIVSDNTLELCNKENVDCEKELKNNNSYFVLEKIDSHIKIKGTNTNVADIQIFALL